MKYLKIFENFNSVNEIEKIWGIDPYELYDLCLSSMDGVDLYAKLKIHFGLVSYPRLRRFDGSYWEQQKWNSVYLLEDGNFVNYNIDIDQILNSKNKKGIEISLSGLGNKTEDDEQVSRFYSEIMERLVRYGIDFEKIESDHDYSSTDTAYLTLYLNNK